MVATKSGFGKTVSFGYCLSSEVFFFDVDHFLKSLLNLLQYCSFDVLVFGRQACRFLVPRPGIEPAPPALGSKGLTTGPPGMSVLGVFNRGPVNLDGNKLHLH